METMLRTIDVIAGPCSAESRDQIFETAKGLNEIGIKTMRAGLWKPRSRYGSFEGVGVVGFPWLQEVQREFGMKVMTEVALPVHVEESLKAGIDMIWIGARTTVNPFMMNEIADSLRGVDIPVFVKNPVCPDLALWEGGMERLFKVGLKRLSIIHRGFCLLDNSPYRNTPLWNLSQKIHEVFPDSPIYCDPSHIAGKRELLKELCITAIKYNYDGLFIESHYNPCIAKSDANQQITPENLKYILDQISQK